MNGLQFDVMCTIIIIIITTIIIFHVLGHFAPLPSQPLHLLKFLVHEVCMNGLPLDVMCIFIIIIISITIVIFMSLAITRFSARNLSSS